MKRVALVFLALVGCRKQEPEASTSSANHAPVASVSANAPPAASESMAPAASAGPSKYTFTKQQDWLGRWTIDVPSTFAKKDQHECTDSGCTTHTEFAGDGVRIELEEPLAGDGNPLIDVVGVRGGKITAQKTLPRGFWVAMTAKDDHVFVQQISGFAEPVRLTVSGPLARKTELEALIGHLSSSLVVPTTRPKNYCKQLPWADGGTGQFTDFDGKLVVGVGLNGRSEDERPYILQMDPPVCDASGFAAWEAQVYSVDNKPPPLSSLVGKRVHLAGGFHPQETAHHHRPIMISVKTIGVL